MNDALRDTSLRARGGPDRSYGRNDPTGGTR